MDSVRRYVPAKTRYIAGHLVTAQRVFIPALEGLRGWAALMVFFMHFSSLLFGPHEYCGFAYLCVDFFFILSGFILARHYEGDIAAGRVGWKHFSIARLARLFPVYLVAFVFVLTTTKITLNASGESFAWCLATQFLLLQMVLSMQPSFIGVAWSTSVEWVVNLLFFAAVRYFRRIPTYILVLTITANMLYLMSHSAGLNLYMPERYMFNAGIARGIAGFCIGCLLFRYHYFLPRLSSRRLHMAEAALLAVLAGGIFLHNSFVPQGIDYVFVLVLFPALLAASLYQGGWVNRFFSTFPMTWLGRISYSIYILHTISGSLYQQVLGMLGLHFCDPWFGMVYVMFVLVLATGSWFFIEQPGRRVGKFFRSKLQPGTPANHDIVC